MLSTICALVIISCAPAQMDLEADRTTPTSISLSPLELHLVEGNSASLEVKIVPWNTNDKTISWKSVDESIATVSEQGKVKAISPGETDVVVQLGELSASTHVFVKSWLIPAESVKFKEDSGISMTKGENLSALPLEIIPTDCNDKVIWSSLNPDIIQVDAATGSIIALSEGRATLIAEISGQKAQKDVYVHGDFWIEATDALEKPVNFQKIPYDDHIVRVARGETATMQAIIYSNAPQSNITPSITRFALNDGEGVAVEPKLWWVEQIKCSEHWDSWAGGRPSDAYPSDERFFPDPLVPVQERDKSLLAGGKQALWIEFNIPHSLPAGIYNATIQVNSTSDQITYDYKVQVYDVDLQDQSMDVIQWLQQDQTQYLNKGIAPSRQENFDFYYPLMIRLLNEYGTNSWWLMDADFSCSPGYEYIDGIRKIQWNFSEEKYKENFELLDNNTDKIHTVHGKTFMAWDKAEQKYYTHSPAVDEQGNVIFENGSFKMTRVSFPLADDTMRRNASTRLGEYFYQLQEFLRAHKLKDGRTWLDVYVQNVADEPKDHQAESYSAVVHFIKSYAPDIKFLEPIETSKIADDALDFPCPTLNKINTNKARGNQTQWMYTCMQPQGDYANRFIRIPLFKTRLVHWVQYKYNAVGYLHWGPAWWCAYGDSGMKRYDEWFDASGNWIVDACYPFLGGDMWIIWPGYRTVYPSIRLSAMRDGIRDYELLRMVEKISPSKAQEFCDRVVIDNAHYNLELNNFKEVRKDILEFLANN